MSSFGFFYPHSKNNHRAKALSPEVLIFYLASFIVLQTVVGFLSHRYPLILGYAANINASELFKETNQKRIENGLKPLMLNQTLSTAAYEKANDMFAKGYWAHSSPGGTDPWFWFIKDGYNYLYAGENLARDFNDSKAVVEAWMNSPTHRSNLLNVKYKEIGFAVVNGKLKGVETTLVVQLFGARTGGVAATGENGLTSERNTAISNEAKTSQKTGELAGAANSGIAINISEHKPKIDIFLLSKQTAGAIVIFLIVVLTTDAFIVYRKRIIRVASHNLAHIGFLTILLVILWLVNRGVIL